MKHEFCVCACRLSGATPTPPHPAPPHPTPPPPPPQAPNNPELRQAVLTGAIAPAGFVHMTSEELAAKASCKLLLVLLLLLHC